MKRMMAVVLGVMLVLMAAMAAASDVPAGKRCWGCKESACANGMCVCTAEAECGGKCITGSAGTGGSGTAGVVFEATDQGNEPNLCRLKESTLVIMYVGGTTTQWLPKGQIVTVMQLLSNGYAHCYIEGDSRAYAIPRDVLEEVTLSSM